MAATVKLRLGDLFDGPSDLTFFHVQPMGPSQASLLGRSRTTRYHTHERG